MRVLIVKTSSMGDLLHTFPALTDVVRAYPEIKFDWVVEEAFAEIPKWHPAVDTVLPIAWRRWRKSFFSRSTQKELWSFIRELRIKKYDLIIDAQGLLKSALVARVARGMRVGFDCRSARESIAACFYQRRVYVAKNQHAITRLRQLFAQALQYQYDAQSLSYGMQTQNLPKVIEQPYVVCVPNTSRPTKHWPLEYWHELLQQFTAKNITVVLPGGYQHELPLVKKIADGFNPVMILPQMSLTHIRNVLANALGIVSVDTGLAHISAALDKPTVVLYGPTDPTKIGTMGANQTHLVNAAPAVVWRVVSAWIHNG